MRITNSIMQNNTLYNINTNKSAEDKLSTQMSTGKKVTKPSDDPVVAIRALRLHTNVTEVKQYYTYNSTDAESWMKTTQDAMDNLTDIIDKLYEQAGKGAKQDLQSSDLQIILKEMNSLVDEYYSIGNTDYAGRYIFTGYRTDTPLTFQKDTQVTYQVSESFSPDTMDEVKVAMQKEHDDATGVDTYFGIDWLTSMTSTNFMETRFEDLNEQSICEQTFKRLRLSYDNLSAKDGDTLTIKQGGAPRTVSVVSVQDKSKAYGTLGENDIRLIPETGELLIGSKAYEEMMAVDKPIELTYEKSVWEEGDLNPEHYFACTKTKDEDGKNVSIQYNGGAGKTNTVSDQKIEYDIGYNQKVQVNTNAYECFDPMMRQDVDDLNAAVKNMETIENVVKNIEEYMAAYEKDTAEYKTLNSQLEAANRAYTYIRDDVQKMFEHAVTRMQGYLDQTDLAITGSGTRSARLDLAKNRLMEQKTTYETLQSENEDSDITEVTVQLKSVQLSYEAALLATSKIIQTTLLNYL